MRSMLLLLLLSGCSTQPLRCDRHLEPINPALPTPRAAALSLDSVAVRPPEALQ